MDTSVDVHVAAAEEALRQIVAVATAQEADLSKKNAFVATMQAALAALKA
jgi:hypothetical protein